MLDAFGDDQSSGLDTVVGARAEANGVCRLGHVRLTHGLGARGVLWDADLGGAEVLCAELGASFLSEGDV